MTPIHFGVTMLKVKVTGALNVRMVLKTIHHKVFIFHRVIGHK
jgi:phage-related holin